MSVGEIADKTDMIERIARACYAGKDEAKGLINEFLNTVVLDNVDSKIILPLLNEMLLALEGNDLVTVSDLLIFGLQPVLKGESICEGVGNFSINHLPIVDENVYYLEAICDDEPVICVKREDKTYNLNSLFSPLNEANYIFEEIGMKTTTPIVCLFGMETGIVAEKILKEMCFDGKLIIYEPDKRIIDYCLDSGRDIDGEYVEMRIAERIKEILDDNRTILCADDENALLFSRVLDYYTNFTGLLGIKIVSHCEYVNIYPEKYQIFSDTIRDMKERLTTNKNTYRRFMEDFLDNPLKNLRFYKNAYLCSDLKNVIPDYIPIVIVSAGPSLAKNINMLKELKGHAVIFAVDTALKYMINENIIPDLTITIDARKQESNFELEETKYIHCIFSEKSNPAILEKQKGEMICLDGQEGYVDKLLDSIGKKTLKYLGTGGSVATAAFAVAYMLKSKYIILVGQDLAYLGEDSHAGGIKEPSTLKESFVEDIYGNQIRTRSDWIGYLRWLEDAIKLIKESEEDIKVIDATEGGAKIHGSEIMTLRDVIELLKNDEGVLPEYDFNTELKKIPHLLTDDEYAIICDKHNAAIENLKNVIIELEEALRICDSLLTGMKNGTVSDKLLHKQNKRLKIIREHLEKNMMYKLIETYVKSIDFNEMAELELQEAEADQTKINLVTIMRYYFDNNLQASKKVVERALEYKKLLNS